MIVHVQHYVDCSGWRANDKACWDVGTSRDISLERALLPTNSAPPNLSRIVRQCQEHLHRRYRLHDVQVLFGLSGE